MLMEVVKTSNVTCLVAVLLARRIFKDSKSPSGGYVC
jgi:hypothetical protein